MMATNKKIYSKGKILYSLLLLIFCCHHSLKAQEKDTIIVQMNNNVFVQGDTVSFEVNLKNYSHVAKTASIQLWIEELKSGKRWKFRYPLVNGYVNPKLIIADSMHNGLYAFNFLLQKTFFKLSGTIKNGDKHDKLINYVMISKTKQTLVDAVTLDEQQSFSLGHLLFQDSAFIIFSRPKQKNNDLLININTPLDSSFVPAAAETRFITIGKTAPVAEKKVAIAESYVFKADSTPYKTILPEVVIKTKMKKMLDDFEKENVSGLFTSPDAIVLDGLESDEIANAPDFYTYLTIKVGGLRLETDNQTGNRSFTWRNQPTEIYINEIRLDPDIPVSINPSDIAMIKIFRPGTSVSAGTGAGGAIAIYTKTGEYRKATNRNYSFYILGYNGLECSWK